MPEVRTLSKKIGNRLDRVRLLWTEARIAAGVGRTAEAITSFERVRRHFVERGMAFDAALVSLTYQGN